MMKRLGEVGSQLELGEFKYTGKNRIGGFMFILVEISDEWSGERFLRPVLEFSTS